MNGMQKRIIDKAMRLTGSEIIQLKLPEKDRSFVRGLSQKPDDYELSEKQNKWLNDIWERISD